MQNLLTSCLVVSMLLVGHSSPALANRVISVQDDVVIMLNAPRDREGASTTEVFRCTAHQKDAGGDEVVVTRIFTPRLEMPATLHVQLARPWRLQPAGGSADQASTEKLRLYVSWVIGTGRARQKEMSIPEGRVVQAPVFGLDALDWQDLSHARELTIRAHQRDVDGERLELTMKVNGPVIQQGLHACYERALAAGKFSR